MFFSERESFRDQGVAKGGSICGSPELSFDSKLSSRSGNVEKNFPLPSNGGYGGGGRLFMV